VGVLGFEFGTTGPEIGNHLVKKLPALNGGSAQPQTSRAVAYGGSDDRQCEGSFLKEGVREIPGIFVRPQNNGNDV
jgi:hypothetical protein